MNGAFPGSVLASYAEDRSQVDALPDPASSDNSVDIERLLTVLNLHFLANIIPK